ncbi:unnamed protein product [[Candida] boidinii]|uniref:Unnamed protein product n=1 Tax=Candida boidinii TaxID=5477 RepID=A0ACB5TRT5_CANBO|nr:unnamed protein product [[Candida] boidinii]
MESVPPTLKTYLNPESTSIISSQIESDESSLQLLNSKKLSIDLYTNNKNNNEDNDDSLEIDNIIINKLTNNNNEILIKLIDLNLAKLITIKILIINLFNNLNNFKYSNLLILLIHSNNKLNDLILNLINFKKLINNNKIENNLSNNCFKNLIIHDLIKFIKIDSTLELNNLNSILIKFIFNDNFKSFYFKSSDDNLNLFNNLYDLYNILLETDLNKLDLNELNTSTSTSTPTYTSPTTTSNALIIKDSSVLNSFNELINNLNNIKFKIILNSVTFKNFKKNFKNFNESNENDLIKLNEFIESESNETFKRSISISSNYKYDKLDNNNNNDDDDESLIQQDDDEIKSLISTGDNNNKQLSQLDLDIINSDSFREFYKLKTIKLGINERKIF